MHLKEIQIKGFKSFANKIKLNITNGITVIVGPNGCGKSNVIDAVRWILGEQNMRSLRGSNLSDMIFAGNKQQKMRNVAEVSIVFNNNDKKLPLDSEEVEIKRIVYRSGDTENYINGYPCRLKEINELFLGTGLGKNSYSIIAQGKVEFVLNAKPSERRVLFEEAASVSIYKNKKESTIKKLDNVNSNLARINDILSEVQENLSYYRKKADDLKLYHSYREKIKKLDYFLLSQQYLLYDKNLKKYQQKLNNLSDEKDNIEKYIAEKKNYVKEIELSQNQLISQKDQLEEQVLKNNEEKTKKNNQLIIVRQKKSEILNTIKGLKEEQENTQKQYIKFNETVSAIENDIANATLSTEEIKERKEREDLSKTSFINILKKYSYFIDTLEKNKNYLIENYINRYKEEIIKNEAIEKSLMFSIKDIEREINISDKQKKENILTIEKYNNNIKIYDEKINNLQKEIEKLKNELMQSEISLKKEQNELKDLQNDLLLKKKEKDFLEELLKNREDNVFGKTHNLKKYFSDKEVLTSLYEIIKEDPFNLTMLFSSIYTNKDNILKINSPKELEDLIHVKKNIIKWNLDQVIAIYDNCDFLNILKNRKEKYSNILKKYRIKGFANDMVRYHNNYSNIMELFFGDIVVIEDHLNAFDLFKEIQGAFNVASLDGIYIGSNGFVILNYFSKNNKKDTINLSTQKIDKIEKDIFILKNSLKEKELSANALKKRNNEILIKMKKIEDLLNNYQNSLQKEKKLIIDNNILESSLNDKVKNLNNKLLSEKNKRENLEKTTSLFNNKIKKIEQYLEEQHKLFKLISFIKEHCLNEIQSLNKKIESYNIKMQWNSERDILLKKQKNEMIQFIQNYQQEESNRQGKIQKLKLEEADLISKESEMIDVYNKLENILNKINSDKIKILAKIKEHDTSLKDLRIDIENTQNKIEKIKNYYYEAEMGRVQNEEKIKYLLETIKNQFNSTVDEVLSYKDETNTQKEASENIAYYKEKISSMGQINFDAIQEFQKHQSRYNELNDKKIDIVKSKEKLIDLIKKIDWIAEDHFLKTFQMVEIYFKDIFQKLFDGGQANLELTNTKRILDAGIEVMVQPPGKKLQNISLLSTGEKSLTAIALLFALWKVNPSPFCFFDEIDSALDETNVLRLANFLKNEDLKEAQIIIITHQRGIMESADAIYGITMEGSGISKLMSVKILDSEE